MHEDAVPLAARDLAGHTELRETLERVPRRIVPGLPNADQRFDSNPFGPLKFTP